MMYELVLVVIIYSSHAPASTQMFTTPVDRPVSPLLSAGYCPPEGDGAPMMVLELMKYGDLQSFLQGNMYVSPYHLKQCITIVFRVQYFTH